MLVLILRILMRYKVEKNVGINVSYTGKDNLKSEGFADYIATLALKKKYNDDFESLKKVLGSLCPGVEATTKEKMSDLRKSEKGKNSHGTKYDRLEFFVLKASGFSKNLCHEK